MSAHKPRDCTLLNLLCRDGMVGVRFTPPLDEGHYAELYEISCLSPTAQELGRAVQQAASRWNRAVEVELAS